MRGAIYIVSSCEYTLVEEVLECFTSLKVQKMYKCTQTVEVSQKSLRASWTSFPSVFWRRSSIDRVQVCRMSYIIIHSLCNDNVKIKPGMSKHLSMLNSTQLLAGCGPETFLKRPKYVQSRTYVEKGKDRNHRLTRDTVTRPPRTPAELHVTVTDRQAINRPHFNFRHNGTHRSRNHRRFACETKKESKEKEECAKKKKKKKRSERSWILHLDQIFCQRAELW